MLSKRIYGEKKAVVWRSFSLVRDYNDAKKVLLFTFRVLESWSFDKLLLKRILETIVVL